MKGKNTMKRMLAVFLSLIMLMPYDVAAFSSGAEAGTEFVDEFSAGEEPAVEEAADSEGIGEDIPDFSDGETITEDVISPEVQLAEQNGEQPAEQTEVQPEEMEQPEGDNPEITECGLQGNGTEEAPYLICSEEDLRVLSEIGKKMPISGFFRLENDLELTGLWNPICVSQEYAFEGTFDGQGYEVRGMTIEAGEELSGLFGYNKGIIRNLTVEGMIAGSGIAGLVAGENTGVIEACRGIGSVNTGDRNGMIVGYNRENGVLKDCSAEIPGAEGEISLAGCNEGSILENDEIALLNTENEDTQEESAGEKEGEIEKEEEETEIWSDNSKEAETFLSDGSSVTLSGEGTEESPYLISTEEELAFLSETGKTGNVSGHYSLTGNIELTKEWTPIGADSSKSFTGIFDGKGFTVSGLLILSGAGDSGLFGYNKGTIRNLTVSGEISTSGNAGLLVGENSGLVENCHVDGSVESTGEHGGLAGKNLSAGTITASTADVAVSGNGIAGGFVGRNEGTVRYSGATGKTTGGNSYAGGFVGLNLKLIENCYANGTATGNGETGGFVGRNQDGNAKISHCYASGMVNDYNGGGFSGNNIWGAVVRLCYYNSANKGTSYGIPASSAQLKEQITYSGWDFDYIWSIEGSYPVISLRGEPGEVAIQGGGTEDNPYVITDEKQLAALAEGRLPLAGRNYYKLGNDIALTAPNWIVIGGNGYSAFGGVFDGCGHAISGLNISGQIDANVGLFGSNNGTIKNLTVNGNVDASETAGILVGENTGLVENCHVSGSVKSAGEHGGLAGKNLSAGTITASTADVAVSGNGIAGGFVGRNEGTVRYSGATGKTAGGDSYAGGFVGLNLKLIENCYANGTVTGNGETGGFVGRNQDGNAKISHCYASGMVNDYNGGGFSGNNIWGAVIRLCYYNSANKGTSYGIPVSAAQLKEQVTYSGWDLDHVWFVEEGKYPVINLRGEAGEVTIQGDGTEENPYVITEEKQLTALAEGRLPLDGKNYYKLGNDIALTAPNWIVIGGNGYSAFAGVFDGCGYTVSGLNISGHIDANAGLFGTNSGTIKNLTVTGNVDASGNTGILVGENTGLVENCHVSGSVKSSGKHGGLAGINTASGTITESTADVAVTGSGIAGGFVGTNEGNVRYSGASGRVT